jgi:hypothetical protein
MARDVEHFFTCFLAAWNSSFEKALYSWQRFSPILLAASSFLLCSEAF